MKTTIFISLLSTTLASAQPLDWKDEAWHPTNPPKKIYPTSQEQDNRLKKSNQMLVEALRQKDSKSAKAPEDAFLTAYRLIQSAEKNIQNKEYGPAKENLSQAINDLESLRKQYPEWGKNIVKYRSDYAQTLLGALPTK
jgi:hypothetical protein